MSDVVWDKLPEKKRRKLMNKINKLARKFVKIDYSKPARTNLANKIKFAMCRMIQKQVHKNGADGLDYEYWLNNGWLDKNRPWKELKRKNKAHSK